MSWTPLTDTLVTHLKTLPVHSLTTNRKEIAIRCPICGDSYKNSRSTHLYIKLDVQDAEPHTYYCQRCKAKGIVNQEFLRQLRIYNSDLSVAIGVNLKNASLKQGNKKVNYLKKAKLELPPIDENDPYSKVKLKYINDRLGSNLSFKDLHDLKIFLHLYDLLEHNNIKTLTCKQQLGDTLDKNFMGFISYDNNYAIMRNLSKKVLPDMRYHNYNIFSNYDNTKRFYVIPTKIDPTIMTLKVCIAEGIFDILGVYLNVEKEHENTLFIGVCGTGYNLVIREIAKLGFLDLDIKFYSDNDQSVMMFKKIKAEFPFLRDTKCEVIYNTLEKDYGVPPEKIKLKRSFI